MKKRILCLTMIALLLASGLTLSTGAEVITGRALDQDWILDVEASSSSDADDRDAYMLAPYYLIQYSLDTETGEMRIFCGEDENGNVKHQQMLPYARMTWVPWTKENQREYIKTVYIEEGVQSLGRYSFYDCDNLKEIYLPHSIRKVNRTAVFQCDNLEKVYYAGNEDDFFYNILYDEVRNWTEDETMSGENIYFKLKDKIHYGESVWVICKNQDGEIFDSYTVGGYFVGDKYTISPKTYEGLTYTGDLTEVTGKFKAGDKTEYIFEYFCEHEYGVSDPSKPCGSFCTKCGCANPEPEVPHSWGAATVKSERGMLTPLDQTVTCTVCGASHSQYAQPYILYIGVVGAALVLAVGITLAIVLPIRRRKKLRDMTW